MDDATFNLSADFLKVANIKKNDYLLRVGRRCNKIAYVDKGLFRSFYFKDGNEVTTCFCRENSVAASFESFVNQTASKENIQALENSTIVTLSFQGITKLYELSSQWQSVGRLLTEKECFRLTERASALSFETALKKYKSILENQPEIIQRVSIQHIASYIGVSRETLSRIRSKISSE